MAWAGGREDLVHLDLRNCLLLRFHPARLWTQFAATVFLGTSHSLTLVLHPRLGSTHRTLVNFGRSSTGKEKGDLFSLEVQCPLWRSLFSRTHY